MVNRHVLWLALPIISAIALLAILTAPAPPRLPDTDYYFLNMSEISRLSGINFNGFLGAAAYKSVAGRYTVLVPSEMPSGLQNFAIRHENCHIEQYRASQNGSEVECYIRMWAI
jgi:hypothetical protein